MDLKIEITNLLALQKATLRFEHGIRETLSDEEWTAFTPSKFVYAFLTFNGIYSFDWENSFEERKAKGWDNKPDDKYPKEEEQFKGYLRTMEKRIGEDVARLFSECFCTVLDKAISKPSDDLKEIEIQNSTKHMRELGRQLPRYVEMLHQGKVKDFYSTVFPVLKFIYRVRCNLFHGRKTRIQLESEKQHRRLEIYSALLIATNSLLFVAAERADIGWKDVEFKYP